MRQALRARYEQILPAGPLDAARQLSCFALAYLGYETVRGLVGLGGTRPFGDAGRIIDLERTLHLFAEPAIQSWTTHHARWLLELADWTYLNAHFALTTAALVFIYLRRNDSFHLVRNTFVVAMLIALVGYCVFPTAPPRLMPQWGFSDSVRQFTGVNAEQGAAGVLLNPYAAVPSMHVCFALMIGLRMSALVRSRLARVLWRCYPMWIAFVVVVTGNHYFTDVVLGALTAAAAAGLATQLQARARAINFRPPMIYSLPRRDG
ncbi:MAG: phosphatase PAP2 family protein [Acidobacteriota bacterium]|nr:phosphatase PAP2 family protein [Acidobacteriota bacterium]